MIIFINYQLLQNQISILTQANLWNVYIFKVYIIYSIQARSLSFEGSSLGELNISIDMLVLKGIYGDYE